MRERVHGNEKKIYRKTQKSEERKKLKRDVWRERHRKKEDEKLVE